MSTRAGHTSIARQLTAWTSVAIIIAATSVALVGYIETVSQMRRDLERQAAGISRRLADTLSPHIWNLDDVTIHEYLDLYPFPESLAWVSILTQYGDPVCEIHGRSDPDVVTHRNPVVYRDEEIGFVEVAISRGALRNVRASAARLTGLGVLTAIGIMLVLTQAIMHRALRRPLNDLLNGIRSIAAGHYDERRPPHRYAEIDAINREVNMMATQIARHTERLQTEVAERRQAQGELRNMRDHLEELVTQRTQELTFAVQRLHCETEERRRIQQEILNIGSQEQRRIGRDLHDSIGQELAGIAFLSSSLEKSLSVDGSRGAEQARQIASLLRSALDKTRKIAKGLNPVELTDEGLALSLERLAVDTEELFGVCCRFSAGENSLVGDNTVATHLFYIAQEATHNATRHGKANQIDISLAVAGRRGTLIVRDDGQGFEAGTGADGMGLRTMHYRTEVIGGTIDVDSSPGNGTTITVTFPNTKSTVTAL